LGGDHVIHAENVQGMPISKTQIDRLGERLKAGHHTESDLRLLDEYRRSFGEAYEFVVRAIQQLGESPTGRTAKATHSIVEKLRRESIRLSQMQDIAGCRVVVQDMMEQDRTVEALCTAFPGASVVDRRANPSHGYRAVHIIVTVFGKPVEIQVRSTLQHLWAALSEKASDVLDPTIKYGGGPAEWQEILARSSQFVAAYENAEEEFSQAVGDQEKFKIGTALLGYARPDQEVQEIRRKLAYAWKETRDLLNGMIAMLDDVQPSGQKP
jgi:putative GTP pyrophosphokinase